MERLKLRYTFYVFVKTVSVLTSLMPMFLFWSQVSNCWWLCELSSHLFRLPRVGQIPSHTNWFYQDKTCPLVPLVNQVQLCTLIGSLELDDDDQSRWHCSLIVPWFTSFFLTHFLTAIHGKSCPQSRTSRTKISRSGPPWRWCELVWTFGRRSRDFQPVQTKPRLWRREESDGFQLILSMIRQMKIITGRGFCVLWK